MDRFDRRPDPETRNRLIVRFALIAGSVLLCFVVLFAFGNAAAPWVLTAYVLLLVWAILTRTRQELSARRLAWSSIPLQSVQGPGFSALELAALEVLIPDTRERSASFGGSEVLYRWNTGRGCLTAIVGGPDAALAPSAVGARVAWFELDGLSSLVGCRAWPETGDGPALLDFFSGGERTVDIDWAAVRFTELGDGPHRIVPRARPAYDHARVAAAMRSLTDAFAEDREPMAGS